MKIWYECSIMKPPSFFEVWISVNSKKHKAYWDEANERWVKSLKDKPWNDENTYENVFMWSEICSNPIQNQRYNEKLDQEILKKKDLYEIQD